MLVVKLLEVLLIGYLLGSIPFGVIVSKMQGKQDIRLFGSGKTGATNVLRTAGKKAAALVVLGDLLKGVIPVILAGYIFGSGLLVIGSFGVGNLVAQHGRQPVLPTLPVLG